MTTSKFRVGITAAAAVAPASLLASACADPGAPVVALEGPATASRAPGASPGAPVKFEDLFERAALQERAGGRRGASVWGQVTFIKSKALLGAAASIAGVESRHAAIVADLTGRDPFPAPLERPAGMGRVLEIVKPFVKN